MVTINNLILSLNVVLPLFLMMALGYFLRLIKLFDAQSLKVMNNLCFRAFLPLLLFNNLYKTELENTLNIKLMLFGLLSTAVIFAITFAVIVLAEKDNKKRGVLIQAIFRSNFIIFGLPICLSLFGPEYAGVPSLLIAVIIPLYNVLAVISLEIFRRGKISFIKILKGIMANPLILASAAGFLFLISDIRLPTVLQKTIQDLSAVATPFALVILGGSFAFSRVKGNIKQLMIGLMGKLVVIPAVFIPISIQAGFRNAELVTLMVMFSAPTAVSSFTMAQQMGGDSELAGQLVVFGTAFSAITIFIWVYLLKSLAFI